MSRSVEEWIGKNDDQRVPDYVRLRVFLKHSGVCHITGRKIRTGERWELEHKKALCNGGEHRETNMAPALCAPHKVKTKQDSKLKAKTDKQSKSHLGIKRPRTIRAWRRFNGQIVTAPRER